MTTRTFRAATVIQVGDVFLDVLLGDDVHQYLRKKLATNLRYQRRAEMVIGARWAGDSFPKHAYIVSNQPMFSQLRLACFETVIARTILIHVMQTFGMLWDGSGLITKIGRQQCVERILDWRHRPHLSIELVERYFAFKL